MKKDINVAIGSRIRERREYFKYTREVFAEMIGISTQFLIDVEHGNKGISLSNLVKISEALNVTVDYLVCGRHSSMSDRYTDILILLDTLDDRQLPLIEELITVFLKMTIVSHD